MAKKRTILGVRFMDTWDRFFNAPTLESFTFRQKAKQIKTRRRKQLERYRKE